MPEKERKNYYTGRPPLTHRPPNKRELRLKAERRERSLLEDDLRDHRLGYLITKLKLRSLGMADDDLKAAYDAVIADLEDGVHRVLEK